MSFWGVFSTMYVLLLCCTAVLGIPHCTCITSHSPNLNPPVSHRKKTRYLRRRSRNAGLLKVNPWAERHSPPVDRRLLQARLPLHCTLSSQQPQCSERKRKEKKGRLSSVAGPWVCRTGCTKGLSSPFIKIGL